MKKILLSLLLISLCASGFAEAIKLKNGIIINGSIVGQTEYVLNVQTSYGTISLNQREIEKIMPDLHRVLLKGGGEFVGSVLDMDEFNLALQTDSGKVNIDVSQIASMEIYDYDEAEKQKKFVENKVEKEAETQAALAADKEKETKAEITSAVAAAGSSIQSAGGLTFDEDLEKVFPSKPEVIEQQEIFKYRAQEPTIAQQAAAASAAVVEEEDDQEDPDPQEEKEKPLEQIKRLDIAKNYFAVHAGALTSNLTIDLTTLGGNKEQKLSGTNMDFGVVYMRRLSNRLWLGGGVAFGMLAKDTSTVADKTFKTTGQVYQIDALANFYINPKDKLRWYLTGGAGYRSLSVDINEETSVNKKTQSLSSSSFSGSLGAGLEISIQDVNVGFESKGVYSSLGKEFEGSSKLAFVNTIKVSWFF